MTTTITEKYIYKRAKKQGFVLAKVIQPKVYLDSTTIYNGRIVDVTVNENGDIEEGLLHNYPVRIEGGFVCDYDGEYFSFRKGMLQQALADALKPMPQPEPKPEPTTFEKSRNQEMRVISNSDSVRIFPTGKNSINEIIAEFAKHGYKVSEKALWHNYRAWDMDYKSAFVENGVELFTPCGCNPLSFTALKAREDSYTYIC